MQISTIFNLISIVANLITISFLVSNIRNERKVRAILAEVYGVPKAQRPIPGSHLTTEQYIQKMFGE
jgi:hypothetical protein